MSEATNHRTSNGAETSETVTSSMFLGVVTVGERGQVVIPAEARREFDIHAGDKLLVVRHPYKAGVMLFKADVLETMMREIMDEIHSVRSQLDEPSSDGESEPNQSGSEG